MAFKKFQQKDILYNVMEVNPKIRFDIYDSKLYYNKRSPIPGEFTDNVGNVPSGFISLYELNVDRNEADTGLIHPFLVKDGDLLKFKSTSIASFSDASYGDTMQGSYPLSSSITRSIITGSSNSQFNALKNTLDYYSMQSREFSSAAQYNFTTGSLISIPSIFYGSSIKKGTIDLKFYVSGTLIGHLKDERRNGELIQVGPPGSPGSSSVAGLALYKEGFLLLTASYDLSTSTEDYAGTGATTPKWIYYAVGANDGTPSGTIPSSSYSMEMNGRNYIPNMTMFAHIEKGEMNNSTNPTFIQAGQDKTPQTGSFIYEEPSNLSIKNIHKTPYVDPSGSFERITYISKIGLYDEERNLIGIATVAKPVKNTIDRNMLFKLKLDL